MTPRQKFLNDVKAASKSWKVEKITGRIRNKSGTSPVEFAGEIGTPFRFAALDASDNATNGCCSPKSTSTRLRKDLLAALGLKDLKKEK